jgi:hypothetical protein
MSATRSGPSSRRTWRSYARMRDSGSTIFVKCLTQCVISRAAAAPGGCCPTPCRPGKAVYQQTQRWIQVQVFEAIVHELRMLLRITNERAPELTALVPDSSTLQATPGSGHRAGYDGHKRRTTSGCPRPWPACTSSPSPAGCSPASSTSSPVHNTLYASALGGPDLSALKPTDHSSSLRWHLPAC